MINISVYWPGMLALLNLVVIPPPISWFIRIILVFF